MGPLKIRSIGFAAGMAALLLFSSGAIAQKKNSAENGLVGIKLYDSGLRVVSVYGTPDQIEAVNFGGSSVGPAGGPTGGRGGSGGQFVPVGGGKGSGGVGGTSAPSAGADMDSPFGFGDEMLKVQGRGAAVMGGGNGPGGGGRPGLPGGPIGPGGGGGTPPGFNGGGQNQQVTYTRWVYNRGGSKYGFVLDRFNRVVQIEAIGIQNQKVRTRKGIGFGSTFAQIIKKYTAPDGYEISGDNVVVRYLTRSKVAFRLSRLGPNKPQVVTGVVVAAGK